MFFKPGIYIVSMTPGVFVFVCAIVAAGAVPACDSEIWCQGPLLEALQTARLFPDSKTFVDMSLKANPDEVLTAFNNLNDTSRSDPAQLRQFVSRYFEDPDTEFETWVSMDYVKNPTFLSEVEDKDYNAFGKDLCGIWKHLGRKIKADVRTNQTRYSLIYLDKPFIVPGGRFRETYYWDSYWVIKGLLTCGMNTTVKGMLENFVNLVSTYGKIPNGNRIYYTERSQPPLFIPMVDMYLKATGDLEFVRENIDVIEREYLFWIHYRSVDLQVGGKKVQLNRFATLIDKPRPESYREDIETAQIAAARGRPASDVYISLASAAESGWDFSSRWFSREYNETSNKSLWLSYIDTTDVIPVDLNSILCWNEKILSDLFHQLGNGYSGNFTNYKRKHEARQQHIQDVFWDSERGQWFDYWLSLKEHRTSFYPSNLFPMFVGCFNESDDTGYRAIKYLQDNNLLEYKSGVPTSLVETGQQWDFPNAWPPMIDVVITSLERRGTSQARDLALQLANQWIESNYQGYTRTHHMFEKYVVTDVGSRGSGGEYDVQEGFGWTNGVVLDLLKRYGKDLRRSDSTSGDCSLQNTTFVGFILLTFFIRLFALTT
ncbi:trehalase-like [Mya arenaria]|uniref:trehalase-like n=1 Tax=Mya arenaria TaxID=6604 RepID=UPI0022E0ACF6|nr:trehalase-like [Mya arenaria]XP_052783365.1 trehalase-like [Mya arenaria]XP_052783366.1 trehalase-like [Mya arenaria]